MILFYKDIHIYDSCEVSSPSDEYFENKRHFYFLDIQTCQHSTRGRDVIGRVLNLEALLWVKTETRLL